MVRCWERGDKIVWLSIPSASVLDTPASNLDLTSPALACFARSVMWRGKHSQQGNRLGTGYKVQTQIQARKFPGILASEIWSPEDYGRYSESRIRGIIKSSPATVDRLRAIGNGVVPIQAAYAFVSLSACLFGKDK